MLNRQQRHFRNYKRHGCKPEDKIRVDSFLDECKQATEKAKSDFMNKLGTNLADPSLISKVLLEKF